MLLFLKFCLRCLEHCYPAVPPNARLFQAKLVFELKYLFIYLLFVCFPFPHYGFMHLYIKKKKKKACSQKLECAKIQVSCLVQVLRAVFTESQDPSP